MPNIQMEQTKSGLPTLKINNYYIHSKYDPVQEAKRFVDNNFKEKYVTILFGYGLGYIEKAYREKLSSDKQNYILVFDPIKEKLIDNVDFGDSKVFNDTTNLDDYIWKNFKNEISKFVVVSTPNYDKLFPNEYIKLMKKIKDYQNNQIVDFATIIKLSLPWEENYSKNRFYMATDPSLEHLENRFTCPIVIASGGPSLNKQLPLLKKFRQKIILIASGSTARALVLNDLVPDFVVSIDPKIENLRHYNDVDFQNATLIYTPQNLYTVRGMFKNAFVFLPSYDESLYYYYINLLNKSYPLLGYGGSCANYAFVVAHYISNGPIAFIGQDLAYTDGQTHADGNKAKWNLTEDIIKQRGLFYVDGYMGEQVLTSKVFYSMKNSFESMNKQLAINAPVFNCTEGGLKIEGFNQISFKQFCKNYCEDNITHTNIETNDENNKKQHHLLLEKMRKERKICKEIIILCNDGIRLLELSEGQIALSQNTLQKLNHIDEKLQKALKKVNLNKILEPIALRVQNLFDSDTEETDQQTFKRIVDQNRAFYKQIVVAVEKSLEFNTELIEMIELSLKEE